MASKKKKDPAEEPEDTDATDVIDEELEAEVTDEVLEKTPGRVTRFLFAINSSAQIRFRMQQYGWKPSAAKEAVHHLHALMGYTFTNDVELEVKKLDKPVADAIAALDALDEKYYPLSRATLGRRHPKHRDFVFADGLTASKGVAAVGGFRIFLNRLKVLEKGESGVGTPASDREALARLASHGIDAKERERLEKLVELVETSTVVQIAEDDPAAEAERRKHLIELRGWFEEWSTVARVAIVRRDHRISLGIAKRRSSGEGRGRSGGSTGGAPASPASPTPLGGGGD